MILDTDLQQLGLQVVANPQRISNDAARAILTEMARQLAATDIDSALEFAHDVGLVTDTDLISAWETGADVLQRAGVLDVEQLVDLDD